MLIALLAVLILIGLFFYDVGLAATILTVAIFLLALFGGWLLLATLLDLFGLPLSRLVAAAVLGMAGVVSALFVRVRPPEDER